MSRLLIPLLAIGATVLGLCRFVQAQPVQGGATLGGLQPATAAAGAGTDVRQDPNSSLDFEAVRGTGTSNIGQNFRGTLGASAPNQPRELGQGLPSSSVVSPSMNAGTAMPDLGPNLRDLPPTARGDNAALRGIESSLILPRFRAASASSAWRYQYYRGRWWYWLPDNRWAYWGGERWSAFGK